MTTFESAEKSTKLKKEGVVSKKSSTTSTKRHRRKQQQKHSEKNKWLIQHPKIQSMDRREKIYVKDAGLNETKAEKSQSPIDPQLDLMSPEVKFGRILAGTDQRKRHAAVKKLQAYLKARCDVAGFSNTESGVIMNTGGISELDLLKLWKALWYTLYMADKKPVQDELSKHVCKLLWCVVGTEEEDECAGRAYLEMIGEEEDDDDEFDEEYDVEIEEIENTLEEEKESDVDDDIDNNSNVSKGKLGKGNNEIVTDDDEGETYDEENGDVNDIEIPHCRGAHLVSLFVRTFFRTIRRDWHLMDKYRIDKFYTLIRIMIREIYEYMALRSWNYGIMVLLNDAIFDEILKQPPNGLRYHLIDLCLEELAKANSKAKIALTENSFVEVMEPFFGLCQTGSKTHDDTVQSRVMDRIFDNFLDNYCLISDRALRENEEDDDDNGTNDKNQDDGSRGGIFHDIHVGSISDLLFALGSDPETSDKYRKSLYEMHKKYKRRLKQIGKDVELESEIEGDDNDDEELNRYSIEHQSDDDDMRENSEDPKEKVADDSNNDDRGSISVDKKSTDTSKIEVEKEKKASKKKKKKKKKRKSDAMITDPVVTLQDENDILQSESNNKEKVKMISSEKNKNKEEEVVITLTEQKKAKRNERQAKKAKVQQLEKKEQDDGREKRERDEKDEPDSVANKDSCRRVSFGRKNRAKSHKASMKALRTSKPPLLKQATPVKGILRKELKHNSGSKTIATKRRKKATSYF